MNRLLIRSDDLTIRSDEYPASAINSSAQTPPQAGARLAPDRAGVTRLADRDLQTLRSAELPLRERTGTRSEAISVISQPGGRPRRDYVPNAAREHVAHLIGNFHKLRDALDEICAINAELLRRREDIG